MCRKHAIAATALIGAGLSLVSLGGTQAAPATQAPTATTLAASTTPAKSAPTPPTPRRKATPQERAAAERLEPLARAAFWAHEVNVDPTDQVAGVRLASALRALGQYSEAAAAAQQVLVLAPDNTDALMETARVYVAQGQGFYAVAPAKRMLVLAPKDWRPLSLLGIAYSQVRRNDDAMDAWREALKLSPENPVVLSNMAME